MRYGGCRFRTRRPHWRTRSANRPNGCSARPTASGHYNVGAETLDQLADDVRRLVIPAQQPLTTYLGDLVATQDRAFTLLEGRQRPEQSRDLYLLAGITCGLMAYASHDMGATHDAMTQARTGYACADNAGHDGLRAWTRGIQALITYYSGRLDDSLRYAQFGADAAERTRGSAGIWLMSSEARALAALNRLDEARPALDRATEARDQTEPDELPDELPDPRRRHHRPIRRPSARVSRRRWPPSSTASGRSCWSARSSPKTSPGCTIC
ncbi:MAG: hypothetical protein ACRDUV_18560 [Pseudonocardiaceae bacterium]